jgi:hypothetical protein
MKSKIIIGLSIMTLILFTGCQNDYKTYSENYEKNICYTETDEILFKGYITEIEILNTTACCAKNICYKDYKEV